MALDRGRLASDESKRFRGAHGNAPGQLVAVKCR
jgi:hypothetical protein